MLAQLDRLTLAPRLLGSGLLLASILLGAALGSGCALSAGEPSSGPTFAHQPQPLSAGIVMPNAAVLEWQQSSRGSLPFDRFEYARRDASLNVVRRRPIEATRQWPEPRRPREERVWFEYWRQ